MTKKKGHNARTQAAREYAKRHEVSYTTALRAIDAQAAAPSFDPPYFVLRDYIGAVGCGKTFQIQSDLSRAIQEWGTTEPQDSAPFSCWVVISDGNSDYWGTLGSGDLVRCLSLPASETPEDTDVALHRERVREDGELVHLTTPEGGGVHCGIHWALLCLCEDVPMGGVINLVIDPYDSGQQQRDLSHAALNWAVKMSRSRGRRISVTRSLLEPEPRLFPADCGASSRGEWVCEPHVGRLPHAEGRAAAARVLRVPIEAAEALASLSTGEFVKPEDVTSDGLLTGSNLEPESSAPPRGR